MSGCFLCMHSWTNSYNRQTWLTNYFCDATIVVVSMVQSCNLIKCCAFDVGSVGETSEAIGVRIQRGLSHQRGSRAGLELEPEKHCFFPVHTAAEPPLSSGIQETRGELELRWQALTVYLELQPENSQDMSRATSWPHGWDATINSEELVLVN